MFPLGERDVTVQSRRDSDRSDEWDAPTLLTTEEPVTRFLSDQCREAEAIQAIVKGRVDPRTWEAFWLVGVLLWTVEETAEHLQMSRVSVYKAKQRVLKGLQTEARKQGSGHANG